MKELITANNIQAGIIGFIINRRNPKSGTIE
jgi:hypothetical protein